MPRRFLTRTGRFFRGKNLLEELSFSCFYHNTVPNQLLHLCSVVLVLFGLFAFLLLIPLPTPLPAPTAFPLLPALFAAVYIVYFFTLDPPTAGVWTALFAALVAAAFAFRTSTTPGATCHPTTTTTTTSSTSSCTTYCITAAVCVATITAQLVGHVVWERRLPAFRAFEAVVITPFFLVMNVLFWCGALPSVRRAVYGLAPQWGGTEKHVF